MLKDYGFGIVAYFDILFSLFVIFCVLSIFSMSLIFLYKKEGGLDNSINLGFKPSLSLYSMGNLGISDTKCYSWFYGLKEKKQTFSCSKKEGVLEIVHKGFKASEDVKEDYDELLGNAYCGDKKILEEKGLNCGSFFDESAFNISWHDNCEGRNNCSFSMSDFVKNTVNKTCSNEKG